MGRGLAEVESNMINPSSPLVDFSKCYENSVPNPWVLVSSPQPQQSDQSRKCTVKSKDPELLHADRNPRTAMHGDLAWQGPTAVRSVLAYSVQRIGTYTRTTRVAPVMRGT